MTTTTKREPPPDGATIKLTIAIDPDMWQELENEGIDDREIEKRICKCLSSLRSDTIATYKAPILDILNCELLKYY